MKAGCVGDIRPCFTTDGDLFVGVSLDSGEVVGTPEIVDVRGDELYGRQVAVQLLLGLSERGERENQE